MKLTARLLLTGVPLLVVLVTACAGEPDPQRCRDGATAVYVDMLDHGLSREAGQKRVDEACDYLSIQDRAVVTDAAKTAVLMGYRP